MSDTPQVGSVVQLTETERRQEIDFRVMAKLGEIEYVKREYMRGFWDCFYLVAFVAWIVCLYYYWRED